MDFVRISDFVLFSVSIHHFWIRRKLYVQKQFRPHQKCLRGSVKNGWILFGFQISFCFLLAFTTSEYEENCTYENSSARTKNVSEEVQKWMDFVRISDFVLFSVSIHHFWIRRTLYVRKQFRPHQKCLSGSAKMDGFCSDFWFRFVFC